MTDREPWPLLAALDELLAREGWQEDDDACLEAEQAIFAATGVPENELFRHGIAELWLTLYEVELNDAPPFLRSRDAAAMLEEALGPDIEISLTREMGGWTVNGIDQVAECGRCKNRLADDIHIKGTEAAARTRAALEAGWRLGLWPVKP
jgi:hypothetical protein